MELANRIFILVFGIANFILAAQTYEIPDLEYENKAHQRCILRPLHKLGEEDGVKSLYELFQIKEVAEYYEDGCTKDKKKCQTLYERVSPRFKDWQQDKLGWVAILDSNTQEFLGFIGAAILPDHKTVEICYALNPKSQKTGTVSRGITKYFNHIFPLLKESVQNSIEQFKLPMNPNNKNSVYIAIGMQFKTDNNTYVSAYLKDRTDIDDSKKLRIDYVAMKSDWLPYLQERKAADSF